MVIFKEAVTCSICHKKIEPGSRIVVTTTGKIDIVGGAGLYKNALTLQQRNETYQHNECHWSNT